MMSRDFNSHFPDDSETVLGGTVFSPSVTVSLGDVTVLSLVWRKAEESKTLWGSRPHLLPVSGRYQQLSFSLSQVA